MKKIQGQGVVAGNHWQSGFVPTPGMQSIASQGVQGQMTVGALQRSTDLFQTASERVGQTTFVPTQRTSSLRQERMRRNLVEGHRQMAESNPEGVQAKFALMKESPFAFFRGTADFFYEELGGTDRYMPKVLCNGDIHPLNFGVLRAAEGGLFFGPNDPDESYDAPFSWDLRRGATAFDVLMRQHGANATERTAAAEAFVSAYVDGLRAFDGNDSEQTYRITANNDSHVVHELLTRAASSDPVKSLARNVDIEKGRFHEESGLKSLSSRVEEFQGHVDAYRATLGSDAPMSDLPFKVKDVAVKHSSGIGSSGLVKYFVLVEGPSGKPEDDMVLEFKQERDSVLERHVLSSPLRTQMDGARAAHAFHTHNHRTDPFAGHIDFEGKSFLVAEYNPYYAEIDPASLSAADMKAYAGSCGRALALAHARADEDTGAARGSMEARILQSINPDGYAKEIASWAAETADNIMADHEAFVQLSADGAFSGLE